MKRIATWLLGLLALLALGLTGFFVFYPVQTSLVLRLTVGKLLANWDPPEFLAGQLTEADFRDQKGGSQKVTAALRERFPVGTSEAKLQADLRRQGFKPLAPPPANCVPRGQSAPVGVIFTPCYDATNTLTYSWTVSLICGDQVSVRWQADPGGNITHLEGGYWGACL